MDHSSLNKESLSKTTDSQCTIQKILDSLLSGKVINIASQFFNRVSKLLLHTGFASAFSCHSKSKKRK
jgi:hypothetical protein